MLGSLLVTLFPIQGERGKTFGKIFFQCFGSGSGLDPDSFRSVDPDPDPEG
jgi:hypothetical protein